MKIVQKTFSEKVQLATNDIYNLYSEHDEFFSQQAHYALDEYLEQTTKNILKFGEMKNIYEESSEKTSQDVLELLKSESLFK